MRQPHRLRQPHCLSFLHLILRCVLKTHAETVAESMGNLVYMHCEKRRGSGIADVGKETFIDWNGPPVHLLTNLGLKSSIVSLEEAIGILQL